MNITYDQLYEYEKTIERLHKSFNKYLDIKGEGYVFNKLYSYYWKNDNKNKEMIEKKILFLIKNTLDQRLCYERLDYLCFFMKKFNITTDVPKVNILTQSDRMEYDPAKNAENIIKHSSVIDSSNYFSGPSFVEIINNYKNTYFSGASVPIYEKKEHRYLDFSEIRRKEKNKPLLFIFTIRNSDKFPVQRIVSARFLSENPDDLMKDIEQAVKDESLDKINLSNYKKQAIEYLKYKKE